MRTRPITAALAVIALTTLLVACGGGDDDEAATTTQGGAATTAPTTSEPATTGGEVVLAETFDDDANGWAPEAFDTETTTGEIADGLLTFSVSDSPSAGLPEGQVALPTLLWPAVIEERADQLADVRVDTTASFTAGSQVGVSCRIVDPTGDDFRSYDFALSSAGVLSIAEVDAEGTPTTLARLPAASDEGDADEPTLPDEPAFEYDPNATYELGAECVGGRDGEPVELTLFLDGEEVLRAEDTDDPIPSGIASVNYGESNLLTQVNGFTPFGVSFDEWTLTDLGGGAPAGGRDQAAPFSSSCDDTTDDLADDKGNPLEGLDDPGTDLVTVSLERVDGVLAVEIQVDGDLPADASSVTDRPLRWGVSMDTDDQAILLETILDGDQFQARIADQAAGGAQLDLEPLVEGDTISLDIPLDEFPMPDEFAWNAFTEWYPTSGEAARVDDVCPNDFGDVAFG